MDNWNGRIKNKPVRYWSRDEIEETGDFYFVTPQYDCFAAYCEDGDCMVYYEK